MIQVSPQDAVSLTAKWITSAGGNSPSWLNTANTDIIVQRVLLVILIGSVVWLFWPYLVKKFRTLNLKWYIHKSLVRGEGEVKFGLIHIHNRNEPLTGCQIKLYQGKHGHYICAPFDLRPEEEIDLPFLKIEPGNYAVMHTYSAEGIRSEKTAWIPQPGKCRLKIIASNMEVATLNFNLIFENDNWSIRG